MKLFALAALALIISAFTCHAEERRL